MSGDLFGAADAILGRNTSAELPVATGADDNVIQRSLRGGFLGARSQISNLVAGGADALGLRDAAASGYARGQQLQAEAQLPENSPRISSFKALRADPTLSNAGEYVGGLLGGSLPMSGMAVGAGLLTGGRAIPAMLAGGAALTPFNTGEVLGRMQTDPEALRMGAGERLARAGGAGVLSAAGESIVPGMVAGKIARMAGGATARKSLGQVAGGWAESTAIESAAEAGGETIKQLGTNFNKPLDTEQITEAAIGGAVAGGAMGTVGAGADLVGGRVSGVTDAIKTGATSIRERVAARTAAATAGVTDTAAAAPKKFNTLGEDLTDLFAKGREAVDDSADRIMNGQPLGDLKAFATAQGERLTEMVKQSDNETVKKVQEWGSQMMADAGLSPERKQAVADALRNVGDEGGRKVMAGLKQAYDKSSAFMSQMDGLRESYKRRDVDAKATEIRTPRIGDGEIIDVEPTVKKSKDYSGTNKAIADKLGPLLDKTRPEVAGDPAAMGALADNLRQVVQHMPTDHLSADTMFRLIDSLGEDTVSTLTAAYQTVADTDPVKAEGFYKNLNELADIQQRTRTLNDFVAGSLVPESQGLVKSSQTGKLVQMLVARARGEGVSPNAGPNQRAAEDRQFRELLATHFGDKADAVSMAIEKEAGFRDKLLNVSEETDPDAELSDGGFDENDNRVSAEALEVIRKGRGPKNEPVMDPDLFKARGMQGLNYAAQYIKDLQAKYPDYDVRFEKAEGTDGMGHVVAEKAANPDKLTEADVQGMRLDKKYPNSKDKLKVSTPDGETLTLDTRRVAKAMKRVVRDEGATDAQHLAKRFVEGLARLTELYGTVDITDNAVIGQIGNKDFTYGMAKKLDPRTITDKSRDAETQLLVEQRKAYKAADPGAKAAIAADAKETTDRRDAARDAELASDGNDGRNTKDEGERDPSKDAQIHEAASKLKPKDLVNRSNMDGSPRHTGDRVTEDRNALTVAVMKWARSDAVPAKRIGERARVLLANFDKMGAPDRRRFIALAGSSPSEASGVVNDLARKYAEVIVLPKPEPTGVKARPAEKEAATAASEKELLRRMEYLNNPPVGYETATARQYVDEAKAQLTKSKDEDADVLLRQIVKKGKSVLEGDASLVDLEGTPSPKQVAAKKAAFLERAASGDTALLKELATSTDAKGLQRAAEALNGVKAPDANQRAALNTVNDRIAELIQDPDVAYGMLTKKYSMESAEKTDPNVKNTSGSRQDIAVHVELVLGKSVKLAWAKLTHAGEFNEATSTIRLSVHALDPMSTAYHESLHAFFAQLRKAGATDITTVLEKAAESAHVLSQLVEMYKDQPAVLAQLKDPEERAAYMYQMWAAGKLTIGPQSKSVFHKIAGYIRDVLGIWSNDARALHIMEYFNSGEYAKNMGKPSAVRQALMADGHNQALVNAREMAKPLTNLADAVFGMGSGRLRDTDIPALNKLADLIKREHTDASGADQGFIAAARIERTHRVNAFAEAVGDYTPTQLEEATVALQRNERAPSPEARLAVRAVKTILAETLTYMRKAGVEVGDLGPDYFPRVWDVHYIAKNQDAFKQMLEPYRRAGAFTGSTESMVASLVARDGNEFGIETRVPGMQSSKERTWNFITPTDAAAFVKPDLFSTMDSYLTQATRKTEWHRRLGGDKLNDLFKAAKAQGATEQDLELADTYLRGIDGTLGDDSTWFTPQVRHLFGNMLVYQNIRLLPLAMFSSLVDPTGVLVRGATVSDAWATFTRGIREIPNTFKKDGGGKDAATELAELMGVIDAAALSHVIGDVYTQGMVGGTAQKINTGLFKYNLMEGLNRSFRVGATQAAIKFIAAHADGTRATHSKRWIDELGLRAGDVVMAGDRMALTEAEGLTAPQAARVRAAVNQWVDGAILRPDAADRPIWFNDPRWALVSHLKAFIYSFQKTILARVAHEAKHGNYTPAMALAGYVPIMIAADLVKGALQGGGDQPEWKKNWGVAEHVSYGVQRSGLMGVGEFPFDVVQDIQRGGSGIGALVGPTVEQLADAVQVVGGRKEFSSFALKAMPANAVYAEAVRGDGSAN